MSLAVRVALLVILATGGFEANAQAQKKAPAPKQQGAPGWAVNCATTPQGLRCQASQSAYLKKNRQRILTAAVSFPPKSKDPVMLFHLAHGIYLPAGVSMQIDTEKAKKVVVEFCDARGCYARLPIAKAALKALKNGKTMSVGFQALNKQTLSVQLTLKGFTAAYEKFK